MDGGKKTLTELQFSTNLIGSNTSLHRKTRTKSNQNIVPNLTTNSRAKYETKILNERIQSMREDLCGNKIINEYSLMAISC